MASFEVIEQEGLRLVKATLNQETIRTESGALYYMRGDIAMESKAPSVGGFFKAMVTGESVFRPTYTGTGEVYLEPSFGGFHVLELTGKAWILENGAYWASDAGVAVDVHREKALTAFKSGEGFMDFQTKVSGQGTVVVQAQGPVEVVQLRNEKLTVDGKYVLGRTAGIQYEVTRSSKSLVGSLTSGEGLVRNYSGSGTILFAPMPYWRERMFGMLSGALMSMQSAKR